MADNVDTKVAANVPVATDVVTYSGDANQNVQLVRFVQVAGSEGSKTVVDLPGEATNGLDVDVTRLPALVAGTANIGDVDVLTLPTATAMNASSSDGGTALTSTAQVIKASAGALEGWYIYNPNTAAVFVQFYNTAAASVTVGTTNPLFMLTIPSSSAANLSLAKGITFGTAMSWAATSTAGGNGAPTTALDAVCWFS